MDHETGDQMLQRWINTLEMQLEALTAYVEIYCRYEDGYLIPQEIQHRIVRVSQQLQAIQDQVSHEHS